MGSVGEGGKRGGSGMEYIIRNQIQLYYECICG